MKAPRRRPAFGQDRPRSRSHPVSRYRSPAGAWGESLHPRDGAAVEPLLADDDDLASAGLPRTPGPVELVLQTRPHTLDQKTHGLALYVRKALHAQDVVRSRGAGDPSDNVTRFVDGRNVDDEALEIVVVVSFLMIVMRRPCGE